LLNQGADGQICPERQHVMRGLQFAELTFDDLRTSEVALARLKAARQHTPVRLQKDPPQLRDVFPKRRAIPFSQCGARNDRVLPISRQCRHHVVRASQPWRAVGIGEGLSGTDFRHVGGWMQVVGIDECPPERVRQHCAYRRLACACGARQHNNHQPFSLIERHNRALRFARPGDNT
jgi:hypothetical protein